MLDRDRYLSHLNRDEDKLLGAHAIDKIELVLKRKKEQSTDFLNPYQRKIVTTITKQIYDINYLQDGAYKRAERKRIVIFPEYLFPDHVQSPVSVLKLDGNFNFQSIGHRDVLGSLLGLGIKRKMLGDILVLDEFVQVVIADEIKDFVSLKLKRIHEVPVNVTEIKKGDIVIPTENARDILATVPSMRLDAVASAGFGDSRNKISRDIKNQKVKLNWKPEVNTSEEVKVDDLISIRGRGRVKVVKRRGLSHRGRIKLLLKRYT